MALPDAKPGPHARKSAHDILRNISYEIMPFRGAEEAVLEHVPTDVALTVTVTEAKGLNATIDLATRLAAHEYRVAPHLAARMVKDKAHAEDLLAQLSEAGIDRVFVIGGDAPTPAGEFTGAVDLLHVIADAGHRFERVGIGGYPEGHAKIGNGELRTALARKARMASHIITQICFDPSTTLAWARQVHQDYPGLDVVVGVPAPVGWQKLLRISASIGLGQSARFLRKQQHVVGKLLRPGGYRPDKLLRGLAPHVAKPGINIQGVHLFTFNELEPAEVWRRSLLAEPGDN
ncbi:methylenetetrahydrofolate reductase [Streptomyces sp. NPDC013178]|uniref:methylenetetrahydrofolate reductase n=1 Tax=Streptomyces sp. NPDC013178 TaxID=3155118 RepID=UPI0033D3CB73